MTPVYFAHPQVLADESMVRLAAFPIYGPVRHYPAFRVQLNYYLADLIKETLEFGEDVAATIEQRLGVPTPAYGYNGLEAREACRLLSLPRENSRLKDAERAGMELALNTYAFALADAILESPAGHAFLTDVSTHYADLDQAALERHFAETKQAVQGAGERQNDRSNAEILQAQALAAEHHADLNLEKYLESLVAYADR